MADKRRLNAEVDKTLKKVEEGKDAFDTLLAKFEQATSLSQREKHGEDLKKEIKKLQRLRDSIKQWQGNPDIKDREALTRSRRDIEVRMEEFKNVERENKSKPYSKEGIMGTPGEPFDPSERTRIQMVRFLEERIDEIETRQKQADVDTDAIKSGKKTSHAGANDDGSGDDDDADEDTKSAARSRKDRRKKKKDGKKSSSRSVTKSTTRDGSSQRNGGGADGEGSENGKKDDQGVQLSPEDVIRVEDLQEQSEKLKSHARNLKVLIRQLDNGTLEADILNDLKDELEAFIVRLDEAHELAEINPLESTVLAVFDDYDEATIYTDYVDKQLLNEMTAMVHNVPAALGNLPEGISASHPTQLLSSSSHALDSSNSTVLPATDNTSTSSHHQVTSTFALNGESTSNFGNHHHHSTNQQFQTTTSSIPGPPLSTSSISSSTNNNPSLSASLNPSLNPSLSHSLNPSLNHSTNHSNNHSLNHSLNPSTTTTTTTSHPPGFLDRTQSPQQNQQNIQNLVNIQNQQKLMQQQQQQQLQNQQSLHQQQQHLRSQQNSILKQNQQYDELQNGVETRLRMPSGPIASNDLNTNYDINNENSNPSPRMKSPNNNNVMQTSTNSPPGISAPLHQNQIGNNNSSQIGLISQNGNSSQNNGSQNNSTGPVSPAPPAHSSNNVWASSSLASQLSQLTINESGISETGQNGQVSQNGQLNGQIAQTGQNNGQSSLNGQTSGVNGQTNGLIGQTGMNGQLNGQIEQNHQNSQMNASMQSQNGQLNQQIGHQNHQIHPNQQHRPNQSLTPNDQQQNGHSAGHSAGGHSSSSSASSVSPNNQRFQNPGVYVHQQDNGLSSVQINKQLALSPLSHHAQLTPEQQVQLNLVEAALTHKPQPADCESKRLYIQRNPHNTPNYHIQQQAYKMDSKEFYEKLQPETLFFVFYYMEKTKAQFLAAKALKKASWRFHTKYLLWFQRHAEPTEITDEFEKGTYVFFDYENWKRRTKEDFKFEYQFLEDRSEI